MSARLREWNVVSMLEWGTSYFKQRNIPDPRHSIEWLLSEALQVKRLDLYLQYDRPLSQDELNRIRPLVKRRALHEPLQYIIGYTNFMNARIDVTPDVLIPRLETEQLVEIILKEHGPEQSIQALDIGTGSGCIPIALKMERPRWSLKGLDISTRALEIARHNASRNEVDVEFEKGDILEWNAIATDETFNLIVSNPPYVLPEEKDELEPQVISYEPHLALFCEDMDRMYMSIIQFAETRLAPEGRLYLEVHELHAGRILSLFDTSAWNPTLKKDYEGKPRFITATLHT